MRPSTPNVKIVGGDGGEAPGGLTDPASPPQTPTSVSPLLHHQHHKATSSRDVPPYQNITRPSMRKGSKIQSTGQGHQFSYTRGVNSNRFAQLSPQSTSEDDEDEDEEEDEEEDQDGADESESQSSKLNGPRSSSDGDDEDDEDGESNDEPAGTNGSKRDVRNNSEYDSDDSDDSDEWEDEDNSEGQTPQKAAPMVSQARMTTVATFTVEELSDFDPMDDNRVGVIQPTGFESPASDRSRPTSRDTAVSQDSDDPNPSPTAFHARIFAHRPRPHHPSHPVYPNDLPSMSIPQDHIPELGRSMSNLNCTPTPEAEDSDAAESDDDDFDEDAVHAEFMARQKQIRMQKRRSHGSSIGKRTHSERSDSDGECDWTPLGDDADSMGAGASARRLRRRIGDRRSLQFQDPPPERIEELEEPESEVDGNENGRSPAWGGDEWKAGLGLRLGATRGFGMLFGDGETLARELPYYDLEIMEVDDEQ